jgi:hypothetical protein
MRTDKQSATEHNYPRILPSRAATVSAVALPWLELAAAASLLTGMWLPVGGGIALLLLGSFMVAVAAAMARGVNLTCGCFGLLYRERVGWPTLSRDGVIAALVLGILPFDTDRFALPGHCRRALCDLAERGTAAWRRPR